MKVKLELVFNDDGRIFLNYWENIHGKDVCCQLRNHDLYLMQDTEDKQISIAQFIDLVKQSATPPI